MVPRRGGERAPRDAPSFGGGVSRSKRRGAKKEKFPKSIRWVRRRGREPPPVPVPGGQRSARLRGERLAVRRDGRRRRNRNRRRRRERSGGVAGDARDADPRLRPAGAVATRRRRRRRRRRRPFANPSSRSRSPSPSRPGLDRSQGVHAFAHRVPRGERRRALRCVGAVSPPVSVFLRRDVRVPRAGHRVRDRPRERRVRVRTRGSDSVGP